MDAIQWCGTLLMKKHYLSNLSISYGKDLMKFRQDMAW